MSGDHLWRGRRVFITGHTGFKGSWLVTTLSAMGAELYGFALPAPARGVFRAAQVEPLLACSTIGDIREPSGLAAALAASQAEVVIHMAAQPLVRFSYAEPVETYATNVMGTVHLLEAVRRTPSVRACVIVTSDKCYENNEWDWGYREIEPMGGYDPYSNSKGCAELVTSAYRRSFFSGEGAARVASGRAGNVIGGGDWSDDRLIPDLIRAFVAGETTAIRNPNAVRPWQHVLDPLFGYLALAERLLAEDGAPAADGWNFGPDAASERTVGEVVQAMAALWGPDARWQIIQGEQPHEAGFLKLDSSKAKRLLGWRPVWPFDTALAETTAWYTAERDGADMAAFTRRQIAAYREFKTQLGVCA
ncbi:CDP-glucose 4,6-dehydratase [Sphingomonas sp.]|uniref:CDP-glucose 4,6-dehydratase n=1 Tax=Sphingomonas sp. TaxID=28214 RepID=UPI000DB3EC24|nr:CDP-glucose 4,6-dehydratase [Sphingomonas sp.]PZU10309.1 MAG: CDP-glucose 4,6-dehydratase [Sphingomonas sp.]